MHKLAMSCAIFLIASTCATYGQIPTRMSYQGLLTTSLGTPLSDGSYSIQFDLYDSLAGGTSQWTETQISDTVHRGTFSAILGSVSPITISFTRTLYLQ